MITKQTKTIKMTDEERAIICDCARVLNDLHDVLDAEEELNFDGSCYDAGFVEKVFSFLCDLRSHTSLTVTRG